MRFINDFISRKSNLIKLRKSLLNILRLYSVPLFSFSITFFFIRWFSLNSWGQVSKYYLWINILCTITNFGAGGLLMRQFSIEPGNINSNLYSSLFIRFPIVILSVLFIFILQIPLELCLVFSLILIVKTIQQTFETIIHFNREYKTILFAELVSNALLILILFLLKSTLFQLFFIFIVYLIIECVKTLFYVFNSKNIFDKNLHISLEKLQLKRHLPFFLLSIVGLLNLKFDQLFSSLHFNNEQIGKYQLISSMQAIAVSFFSAITQPFIRNLYRMSEVLYRKLFIKLLFFVIPTSIVFALIIQIVLNQLFQVYYNFSFITIVSANIILLSINSFLSVGVLKLKKENLSLFVGLISISCITICALFIFNNFFELGLLISLFISQIIVFVIQYNVNFGNK